MLPPTSTVTGLTFTTAGSSLTLGPLTEHAPRSRAVANTAPIDFIDLIPLWNRLSKSISAAARATGGGSDPARNENIVGKYRKPPPSHPGGACSKMDSSREATPSKMIRGSKKSWLRQTRRSMTNSRIDLITTAFVTCFGPSKRGIGVFAYRVDILAANNSISVTPKPSAT